MIILSVDPGQTTGFSICDSDERDSDGMPNVVFAGVLDRWVGLATLLKKYRPSVVVAEKFILYAGRAKYINHDTLIAVRVLGVLEYLTAKTSTRFVEQQASVGKSFRLSTRVLDEYRNAHVRDSLRHMMAYLRSVGD